ncbi:MAG: right-handed parallel beta-helix repeat-containing protein, partial [Bacteroidota bacterium]
MRCTFLALSFLLSTFVQAQTSIPAGNVSGTWTLAGSPYLIQGNILVPDNMTLTVEPGVIVEFQGHHKLFCNGRILAVGTSAQNIRFTTTAVNIVNGWLGIRYEDTPTSNDSSYFKYCIVEYGNVNANPLNDHLGGAFYFKNFSKCVIDNSTLQNNSAKDGGGAIYGDNSSPRITNNYFYNNIAPYQGYDGIELKGTSSIIDNNVMQGSGIAIYNSTTTISNNHVSGSRQGGITAFNCNLDIRNNIFENNTNSNGAGGGGILAYECTVRIVKNIIRNNSVSTCGGGITLFDNSENNTSVISNNLLYGNSSGTLTGGRGNGGAGIFCAFNSPQIINNTICNNTSGTFGGGLYCVANSDPVVQNNIIYNNLAATGVENIYLDDNLSDPTFFYNDIQGNIAGINSNGNPYTGSNVGNVDVSPGFVDQANFNYDLAIGSACIDGGNTATVIGGNVPALDLAERTRIKNNRIDIGAYEYQAFVVPVRLLYFTAQKKGSTGVFYWQTELPCREFEVQRSINGTDYNTISILPSAINQSSHRYSYTDLLPTKGKNYYRLKMKDENGSYTYSNISVLEFDALAGNVFVYPNPVLSSVFIESNFANEKVSVKL